MTNFLNFRGVIRNVRYKPCVRNGQLMTYSMPTFDVRSAKTFGMLVQDDIQVGYSTWVSPKRTRSYPFARLYNIYHLPKKITVIPIIKDEGINGDCDRINYITLSWMNLANVFIILGYYDEAIAHPQRPNKITKQKLNNDYIQQKLQEILDYQQTALHWNIHHFSTDFDDVFQRAIDSYTKIQGDTDALMHSATTHQSALANFQHEGHFSIESFRQNSLASSFLASQRELNTQHRLEYLSDGAKAYFSITNWLGGEYHLTADEIIFLSPNQIIIQESKNHSHGKLPSLADIQDGLFKLMLFANMEELFFENQPIHFITRLKLTGNCVGNLLFPVVDMRVLEDFVRLNNLSNGQQRLLQQLNAETQHNPTLQIIITGHA
jgi:hypothetical protein